MFHYDKLLSGHFSAVATFQFNPSTYTVAEDVAGGQQAVSLELVSGTLTTNIGIQVTVTGGTATLNGMYHWYVGWGSYPVL